MLLQATELTVRMDRAGLLQVPSIVFGRFDPFMKIALAHSIATALLKKRTKWNNFCNANLINF